MTIYFRLRYLQTYLSFQSAGQGFSSRTPIPLRRRDPAGVTTQALTSLPLVDSLPFSDTASDVLKAMESIRQLSYCSLGPTLLMLWLLSERRTRLSTGFLKKKISRLRYSNCQANGITGDHYKIFSELSLHASKSKKLIYCRYTVERGN